MYALPHQGWFDKFTLFTTRWCSKQMTKNITKSLQGYFTLQTLTCNSFPGRHCGKYGLLSLMSVTETYTTMLVFRGGEPWSVTKTVTWWCTWCSWSNATQLSNSPKEHGVEQKRLSLCTRILPLWTTSKLNHRKENQIENSEWMNSFRDDVH